MEILLNSSFLIAICCTIKYIFLKIGCLIAFLILLMPLHNFIQFPEENCMIIETAINC